MEAIDQVRQVADIVDIASLYTTLNKRGRKHVGLCPFHSEKTPSFTVDSEKQLFHCFGCGVGGDVFTLVMEKENMTFPEALNHLAERYHVPLPQKSRLSPELQKLEDKVYKINEQAVAFFRRCLLRTKEGETARAYLRKRGLSDETLETLQVGYAPNSWTALVSDFREKGHDGAVLEKAGLALPGQKKPGYYDRFRGRVIFPIFTPAGKPVAFGGRTIVEADPKYLNSPDTPVYSKGKLLYGLNWTKEALREAGEAILVEGYTDFSALYQTGIRNVAASLGTALTPYQVDNIRRAMGQDKGQGIVINYDGDSAGRNAALRAVPLCLEKALPCRVVLLPQNLDPDAYVRKHGRDAYLDQVKQSVPGLKFLVGETCRFYTTFVAVKKFYDDGDLGDLIFGEAHYVHDSRSVFVATPWRIEVPQDVLFGGLCHPDDSLVWLFGEADEVQAYGSRSGVNPAYPLEDTFIVNIRFASGRLARVLGAYGIVEPPIPMMGLGVYGTKGSAVADFHDFRPTQVRVTFDRIETRPVFRAEFPADPKGAYGQGDAVRRYMSNFEASLAGAEGLALDAREGTKTIAILAAAQQSVRSGGVPVAVRRGF